MLSSKKWGDKIPAKVVDTGGKGYGVNTRLREGVIKLMRGYGVIRDIRWGLIPFLFKKNRLSPPPLNILSQHTTSNIRGLAMQNSEAQLHGSNAQLPKICCSPHPIIIIMVSQLCNAITPLLSTSSDGLIRV